MKEINFWWVSCSFHISLSSLVFSLFMFPQDLDCIFTYYRSFATFITFWSNFEAFSPEDYCCNLYLYLLTWAVNFASLSFNYMISSTFFVSVSWSCSTCLLPLPLLLARAAFCSFKMAISCSFFYVKLENALMSFNIVFCVLSASYRSALSLATYSFNFYSFFPDGSMLFS